jgi:hypothetical protein
VLSSWVPVSDPNFPQDYVEGLPGAVHSTRDGGDSCDMKGGGGVPTMADHP